MNMLAWQTWWLMLVMAVAGWLLVTAACWAWARVSPSSKEWPRAPVKKAEKESWGWVVADAQDLRFRKWGDLGPEWTEDAGEALHFTRRQDAESFCAEDEDAWRIRPHFFDVSAAERRARAPYGMLPRGVIATSDPKHDHDAY